MYIAECDVGLVRVIVVFVFFFFKQKTAYEIVDCDWSSDVCSSDLEQIALQRGAAGTELMPSLTDMANEPIDIVSSKYDMIYNRGLQKTIDKFISQSDNKITKTKYKIPYRYTSEQREEIEKAGLLGDVIDSAVRGRNPEDLQIMSGFSNVFPNLDKPATLLDITNFKFFPKVAQARFSKGGLVKKRGLMRKKVAA